MLIHDPIHRISCKSVNWKLPALVLGAVEVQIILTVLLFEY